MDKTNIIENTKSTVVMELRFWSPLHYKDRKNQYKKKKAHYNYYDGIIRIKDEGGVEYKEHFHSAGEMLNKIEEIYKKYVNIELKNNDS